MIKKLFIALPLIGAFLLSAGAVNAATTYNVLVNTSSLSGTTGAVDFMFNPGVGIFQSATVQIAGVTGGAYGGAQQVFGSATGGPVPSSISITNSPGNNEVLDSYRFGNSLALALNFSGPAITSPNGSDTAGSLFAFSIFSDAAGTVPALTSDPNGIALEVNVSTQGAVSSAIISPNVQITPEPSTLALLAVPLALLTVIARRRSARAE